MNETLLRQYAEFAVRVGVNPQPGQTLIISAPVEGAAFARMCAEAAYDAGAREVVMKYSDERFSRLRRHSRPCLRTRCAATSTTPSARAARAS